MALDTFGNLKTSIVSWSKRTDTLSLLADFILLAEAEMWKTLRIRDMETSSTDTASSKDLALPTNYIEMRRVRAISGGEYYDINFVTPNGLEDQNTSGIPRNYTITDQINFDRATTYDIETQFYAKLTALSDSNTSNAVLSRFPDIYLFGSLWALWRWAMDIEKSEYYYALFQNAIKGANKEDESGRYSNPRIAKKGSTP